MKELSRSIISYCPCVENNRPKEQFESRMEAEQAPVIRSFQLTHLNLKETSAEQAEGNGNTSQALTHRPVEEKGAALEHVEPSSEANVAPEHLVIDQPNSGAPTPSAEERTSEPMRSPEDGGPERSRAEAPAESGATVATAHSIEGDQMETQTTHAEAEESQEKSLEPTWPVEPSVEDKVGEQAQASVEAPFVATVAPESAEIDKAERTTCAEQAQEADESRWGSHKPSVQGKSGVEKAQPSADSLTATVEGERAGVDKTEEVAHIEEACSATKGTLEQTVPHEPSMEDTVGAEQAQPAAGATMEVENAVLDKTEEAAKKKHTDEAGETSLEQTGPHESSMKDNTCAEQAEPTVQPSAVASVAIIIEADSAVIDNTEAATHAEADEMSSKPTLPHQLSMENTVGTGSAQSSVEATDATTTVEEHAKIDKTEETSRVAETEETDASTLEQALPHEPAMKDNAVAEQAQQSVEAIVATTAEKSAEIYKKEFEPALPVEPSMEDEVGAEQVQPSAMAPVAITVEADSAMMAKTEAAAHAKQAEEADEMSSKPTLQHQPSMEDRVGTGSAQASVEATDATTTVEENAKIEKTEETSRVAETEEADDSTVEQALPHEPAMKDDACAEQAQQSVEAIVATTAEKSAEIYKKEFEPALPVEPSMEDEVGAEQVQPSAMAPVAITVEADSAVMAKTEAAAHAKQADEADEMSSKPTLQHQPSMEDRVGTGSAQASVEATDATTTVEENAKIEKTEETSRVAETEEADDSTLEQALPHEPAMKDDACAEQAQQSVEAIVATTAEKSAEIYKKELEPALPVEPSMEDEVGAEQVQPSAMAPVAITVEANSAVMAKTEAAAHAKQADEADEMSLKPTLQHQPSMEDRVGTGSAQASVEATDATTTVEENAKIEKTEETSRVAETEEADDSTLEQALPHEPAMKDDACAEQAQQSVEAIVATTAEKSAKIYKKEFEPALPVEPSMEDEVGAEQVQPSAMAPVAITVEADSAVMAKTEAAAHAKQADEADEMSLKPTLQHQPSMEDRVGTGSAQASVEATDATTTVEENAKIEKTEETSRVAETEEADDSTLEQALPHEPAMKDDACAEQAQQSVEAIVATTAEKSAEIYKKELEPALPVEPSMEDEVGAEQVQSSAMAPVAITVEADSTVMAKTEAAAHAKQAEEADEMSSKPTLQHQPSMEDRVGTGSAQASVEATDATTTVEENAKIEKTEKTTHAEQADEMKEGRLKQSLPGELSTQVSLAVEQAQPSPEAFLASTEGKEIARHTQKAEADESRSEQSSFVKPSIEDKGCIEQVRQRVEPAVLEPEVEAPREAARSVKNLGLDEAHLDRGSESFTSSGATEAHVYPFLVSYPLLQLWVRQAAFLFHRFWNMYEGCSPVFFKESTLK